MSADLALFAVFAALGLRLQRSGGGDELRRRVWAANYLVLIPLAATYAFLSIDLDRHLLAIFACSVVAWWVTVAAAGVHARVAASKPAARGALWLVGAFPNTGFVGFPLAHLAYGRDGLRLAVVYDQVSLIVPAIVVSTVIARRHGTGGDDVNASGRAGMLREVVSSPPLLTVLILLVFRLSVAHDPIDLETLGAIIGHVVGPVGFFLLGLSLPLGGVGLGRREVVATGAAVLVRIALAPALTWTVARTAGVELPSALYLIAAMPTAFHALVIGRIHGLDAGILRLGILVSSTVVIGGAVVAVMFRVVPGA